MLLSSLIFGDPKRSEAVNSPVSQGVVEHSIFPPKTTEKEKKGNFSAVLHFHRQIQDLQLWNIWLHDSYDLGPYCSIGEPLPREHMPGARA